MKNTFNVRNYGAKNFLTINIVKSFVNKNRNKILETFDKSKI